MKWRLNLLDEDYNEYQGEHLYNSRKEAQRDFDEEMESDSFGEIDGKKIIGISIEEVDE